MIFYLEMPEDKYKELKKIYPIRRSDVNNKLYYDTHTPYFGRFMNTGMPFQLQDYIVGEGCWDNVMYCGN